MDKISNITCYKTLPKTAKYEGKLKKRRGSQVRWILWTSDTTGRFTGWRAWVDENERAELDFELETGYLFDG
jgi:hypothetical protein